MDEINEFEKAYCTHYKCSPNDIHSTPIETTSQMKPEVPDSYDSTTDGFVNNGTRGLCQYGYRDLFEEKPYYSRV